VVTRGFREQRSGICLEKSLRVEWPDEEEGVSSTAASCWREKTCVRLSCESKPEVSGGASRRDVQKQPSRRGWRDEVDSTRLDTTPVAGRRMYKTSKLQVHVVSRPGVELAPVTCSRAVPQESIDSGLLSRQVWSVELELRYP
jgi:hypothetical protein